MFATLRFLFSKITNILRNPGMFFSRLRRVYRLWLDHGAGAVKNILIKKIRENTQRGRLTSSTYSLNSTLEIKAEEISRSIHLLSSKPLISIIMPVYNTPEQYLRLAIESVQNQLYPHWELCICDDGSTNPETIRVLNEFVSKEGRIRFEKKNVNCGISSASNTALKIAKGEYIVLLDHDDELTADALYENVKVLNEYPKTDVIYSDQDKIDLDGNLSESFYKPDWSQELFRGVMYVGHLLLVRSTLAREVGGFNPEYDKVQDYEFMLRLSEATDRIEHIPRILYHWRKLPGSIAFGANEKSDIDKLQVKAINAHLKRCGVFAEAQSHSEYSHRSVIYPNPRKDWPLVSIIIPSKNAPENIGRCLKSIFSLTTYKNYEVIIIDNETTDQEAIRILHKYPVKVVPFNEPFNYSRANNIGAKHAKGKYLILLNNDTEVLTTGWIENLLFHLELPNVGAVGPLLIYPDKTVQHAGVVLGFRGTADHLMRGYPADSDGYAGSLSCTREVTAVTGACLMIGRDAYLETGGLVEYYATHYQDLDLCLRLYSGGKRILYVSSAKLIHHEGVSRGKFYDHLDRALLLDTWGELINNGDPFYNKNFSRDGEHYSLCTKDL